MSQNTQLTIVAGLVSITVDTGSRTLANELGVSLENGEDTASHIYTGSAAVERLRSVLYLGNFALFGVGLSLMCDTLSLCDNNDECASEMVRLHVHLVR